MVDVLSFSDLQNLESNVGVAPAVEPQPEVQPEVQSLVQPEVKVESPAEVVEPVSEMPSEDVGGFETLTLKDLGIEPTTDEIQIPVEQSQERIPTLRLQDLQVPFGGFNLEAEDRFVNVYDVFEKYDNKPLTKEDIVADPDLMEVVYQSLEARFPEAGFLK